MVIYVTPGLREPIDEFPGWELFPTQISYTSILFLAVPHRANGWFGGMLPCWRRPWAKAGNITPASLVSDIVSI